MNIISEAATNHFGSLPLMWRCTELSLEAGADFVKFQLIDTDKLYAPGDYEYGTYQIDEVRWLRRNSMLSSTQYLECVERCRERFGRNAVSATPFDLASLEFLVATEPPFVKIASGDNNYIELLSEAAGSGLRVILSTGMSDYAQIDLAVNTVLKRTSALVLMHCVAEYPHDFADSQMGTVSELRSRYGVEIGYSDHSLGTEAAVLAASMGVTWFEKHFTLSRNNGGLDAKHSLEPPELARYCSTVRATAKAQGQSRAAPTEAERYTARRARRGIYYSENLAAGTCLQYEHFAFLRPEQHASLEEVDQFIGKTLKHGVRERTPVKPSDV